MKSENNENIKAKLTEGSVGRLLVKLTLPMIFGILSMVIYNLVDTFFVSRLGKDQMAALTFTFPVVLIVGSVAHGLGVGASSLISRAIGENDIRRVRRLSTDSLVLSFLSVVIFVAAGLLTIDPLFRLLGAGDNILPFIKEYMYVWYPGMVFVVFPMVGNNIIRATGDTKTPGIVMFIGAMFNSFLDPLLIFGSDTIPILGPVLNNWGLVIPPFGIRGAAAATLIGRSITFIVAIYILGVREKLITFQKPELSEVISSWKEILSIGLPNAGSRMIIPLGTGVITRLVSEYGVSAVAGYGIATRIEFFALAPIRALSSVIGPFIGQNFGAGLIDRVEKGIRRSREFSLIIGGFFFVFLFFFSENIALIFNDNPDVVSVASLYLKIVAAAYGLHGICLISSIILNVFKKPYHAVFISFTEIFLFSVPLALVAGRFFGIPGIFSAIGISYFISGFIAVALVRKTVKRQR